jgi:hypothetical protein
VTDGQLRDWWPELGAVVGDLRRIGHAAAADALVDAVAAGATSGEILDGVGGALRSNRALRSRLCDTARDAWDAVAADVDRACHGCGLGHWLTRLTGR